MKKKLAIGADHAGFEMKEVLKKWLQHHDYKVEDLGTNSSDSVDYPDFAHAVAKAVETGAATAGILLCGSANGVAMSANKHEGVRAAIAWKPELAELGKQHNNANVLCIPSRFVKKKEAKQILKAYLKAKFEGGRHERRVNKIEENPASRQETIPVDLPSGNHFNPEVMTADLPVGVPAQDKQV